MFHNDEGITIKSSVFSESSEITLYLVCIMNVIYASLASGLNRDSKR